MFDKFTHKSQEAIINAQIIAQEHGQQQIEALHVLASLLSQSESLIKPILERSKKEADKIGDEYISTEHMFLALIGIRSKAQEILISAGVSYDEVLKILAKLRGSHTITDPEPESKFRVLEKYAINLTELARGEKLDPVIGRDEEIRRIMQVLSRRTKNNPVLIGEAGT